VTSRRMGWPSVRALHRLPGMTELAHESAKVGRADPFLRLVESIASRHESSDDAVGGVDYRGFLEALGVAVYTTDAHGAITYFNKAAADLWGRRPELGEEWCGSFRLFWSDGSPLAHGDCPMAIALREGRAVRGFTAIAERPDGSRIDFQPYPTPLYDKKGRMIGAVNVLVDITERRRMEDDLRSTAEALALSNGVKDEFLGLISHELRTPVTTIYGNAQLLRDRSERLPVANRAEMVTDIAEDSERLLGIIENLLLLSRMQSGTSSELEPQVLAHVIRDEIGEFSRRHPGRDVRFSEVPGHHVIVEADRTHLVLLLQNLLSNAHKYGGPDGIIEIALEAIDGEARVRVLDRGLGLDGTDVARLFSPFYRSAEAQRTAGGLGLGLPVCDRIVTALGGRMWATPRDGGGAEFAFALPLAPSPGEAD
jgi:PAS domain S-box-containing protein